MDELIGGLAMTGHKVPVNDGGNMFNHPQDNWVFDRNLLAKSGLETRFDRPHLVFPLLHGGLSTTVRLGLTNRRYFGNR